MFLAALLSAALVVGSVSSSGVTIGITPLSHPVQTQFHSQDALGQYVYGYATPTSSKSEAKSVDGVTRGGYSYIDSFGILQTVHYISDPVNGFRVAATNIPQDLPEVAIAKARHLADVEATKITHARIAAERVVQYSNPVTIPFAEAAKVVVPAPVQDLPEVVRARAEHLAFYDAVKARDLAAQAQVVSLSPVPDEVGNVVPIRAAVAAPTVNYATASIAPVSYVPAVYSAATSSQYHSQDSLGQYTYGYTGPLSSKAETKTADGITRGGYSYLDANGILQTVHYISDPVNGFRVAATNLPVGPAERAIGVAGPVVAAAPAPIVAASAPIVAAPLPIQRAQIVKTVQPALYAQEVYYK